MKRLLPALVAATLLASCGESDEDPTTTTTPAENDAQAKAALADAAEQAVASQEPIEVDLSFRVESDSAEQEGSFSGKVDPARMAAEIVAEVNDETEIQLRADGERGWFSADAPEFTDYLPAGKRWVAASAEDLREADALTEPEENFTFALLLLGAENVRETGSDSVGEDPVTRYEFDIDQEAAVEAAPRERRVPLEEALRVGEDGTVTGSAALDAQGRLREIEIVGDPRVEENVLLTISLTVDEIGRPFEVVPPPPAETVPLEQAPETIGVLRELGGG